jgi:hypothetical protein
VRDNNGQAWWAVLVLSIFGLIVLLGTVFVIALFVVCESWGWLKARYLKLKHWFQRHVH